MGEYVRVRYEGIKCCGGMNGAGPLILQLMYSLR